MPDVDYMAFDGTNQEYAKVAIAMPDGWNEGQVRAQFVWRRASGATPANVVWGMRGAAVSNGDSIPNFGSGVQVTSAAQFDADKVSISGKTPLCTIGGSPSEGDLVMFEFTRVPYDAADTLDAVDAHLIAVRLYYTTSEPTDA
jgi:hypothetical protein